MERQTTDIVNLLMEACNAINEITLQKHIKLELDQASRPNYQFKGYARDREAC